MSYFRTQRSAAGNLGLRCYGCNNKDFMDPIRRLLSYATMHVDLDIVPNFFKLWYHFFNKINCGKYIYIYIYIYIYMIMCLDKHASNN